MILPKLFILGIIPLLVSNAYAHTVDSAGEYRLEIGWINEPAISGEANGIELYVSELDPNLPAEDQDFKNGIKDLEKDLKIQLAYKTEKINLPLKSDHNTPGKYYAMVDPTITGFYQVNVLGKIDETLVSKSMHPPKVENRTFIEFPIREGEAILSEHKTLTEEIKETLTRIENTDENFEVGYVGVGLGLAGIIIASVAISKRKGN